MLSICGKHVKILQTTIIEWQAGYPKSVSIVEVRQQTGFLNPFASCECTVSMIYDGSTRQHVT